MLKIWGGHASPWLRLWRIRDGHLTNITNRREKKDNSYSPIYDFCEKLAHCANAKNIECEAMWLFLKNTHLVHPCTPHPRCTPLENPGTPWGVRYTRLTSTGLEPLHAQNRQLGIGFQFLEMFWRSTKSRHQHVFLTVMKQVFHYKRNLVRCWQLRWIKCAIT